MMNRAAALTALLLLLALTACDPGPPGDPSTPPASTEPPAATATPPPTLVSAQPPAATPGPAVVDRLKADLAARLTLPVTAISVVSLTPFTWPDGCLGIGGPGVVCTQALVPGWLAVLRTPDGREFRYRGAGDRFAIEP